MKLPLKFAIPVVIVATTLLLRLAENSKMRSDAAIAWYQQITCNWCNYRTTGLAQIFTIICLVAFLAMSKDDVVVSGLLSVNRNNNVCGMLSQDFACLVERT